MFRLGEVRPSSREPVPHNEIGVRVNGMLHIKKLFYVDEKYAHAV